MPEKRNIRTFYPSILPDSPQVTLTVVRGPGEGASLTLRHAVELIGSRQGCRIHLNHKGVLSVHAAIINTGREVFLRDMATSDRTLLDALPVVCESLEDGDMIRIASWEFLVSIRHPADTGDGMADAPVDLEPESQIVLHVDSEGRLVRIRRQVGLIGRRPGCDLILQSRKISRAHALIAIFDGQPMIYDLLCENGITHNGRKVHAAPIQSGDTLEFAGKSVRVVIPQGFGKTGTQAGGGAATTVMHVHEENDDLIDIRAAEDLPARKHG